MYSELEEYFNIDTEDMTKNQIIETIEDSISKKIQEETDFFKFLSLYGNFIINHFHYLIIIS
jgi:hypothetical protein